MKTAEEVIEEIAARILHDLGPLERYRDINMGIIVSALTWIRAKALEEAAKIAEFHSGPSEQLAVKIRALKDK